MELRLFPKVLYDKADRVFGCFLQNMGYSSQGTIKFNLSLCTKYGSYTNLGNCCQYGYEHQYYGYLKDSKLLHQGLNAFVDVDTLTLKCRIWEIDDEPIRPGQCYARTVIGVERITYLWKLDNFADIKNEETVLPCNMLEMSPVLMHLTVSENFLTKESIQIKIKQAKISQNTFFTCGISLLGNDGRTVNLIRDKHWYEKSEDEKVWNLPIILIEKLTKDDKVYLQDGSVHLRCEFSISTGVVYSRVETCQYEISDEDRELDTSYTLKDGLLNIYEKGQLSDLIIRTSTKDFAVHKNILAARSEVFGAMFEYDTKENRSGIIEIEDLEDEVVSKLLLFIYTDDIEDLDFSLASKLYFAADKYGIMSLKRNCTMFLKDNLNVSNVCEALVLSDLHQDKELESAAQDFMQRNAKLIMNSEEWNEFMQKNVHLASKTMHLLFVRNLNM